MRDLETDRTSCLVEGLATALLLAAVVGSGIMAERLSNGNAALALLANSLATGGALVAILLAFPGAHLNPAVTVVRACRRELSWRDIPGRVAAQVAGGLAGVWAAHYMFEAPVIMMSKHARTGGPQWAAEAVATLGLLCVVLGSGRRAVPFAVGSYVMAAYWFTSSTSFANPAVTLARAFTDTFTGIRLVDVPAFVAAQAAGAALATVLFRGRRPEDPA